MHLLIENSGYHLLNLGDVAMLQAGVQALSTAFPGAELHVVTTAPDRLSRFCPGTHAVAPDAQQVWRNAKATRWPMSLLPSAWRKRLVAQTELLKLRAPMRAIRQVKRSQRVSRTRSRAWEAWPRFIENMDAVVSTGGGFLNDTFPTQRVNVLLTMRLAQAMGKPTAWFGQGIGPLQNGPHATIVATALREARVVSLREGLAARKFAHVHDLDFARFHLNGDDAFVLLASLPTETKNNGAYIGVNVRPAAYAQIDESAQQNLGSALASLASQEGCPILPLAVSLPPTDDDAGFVRQIVPAEVCANEPAADAPKALYAQVQRCRLVVTASYHAAIFALAAGVPVVGLSASAYYDQKFDGLKAFFPETLAILRPQQADFSLALEAVAQRFATLPQTTRESARNTAQEIAQRVQRSYDAFRESFSHVG